VFVPQGREADPWGAARSLFAAGVRPGDLAANTFSYHMTPGAFILESGLQALGCPVIAAGPGNAAEAVPTLAALGPTVYCGVPDYLNILQDRAEEAGLPLAFRKALVSGAALPGALRQRIEARGCTVAQAYATADLGVIAYESAAREGLILNEGLILEIVRPGTGTPVPEGDVGEVVVTRLGGSYPLLRLATGDLSAILPGASPCGRTNMRIRGWMGRADQRTKVKGMFVDPGQVAEVVRRHPEIARARLVVTREDHADRMTLRVEAPAGAAARIAETLRAVTNLSGTVEPVAPGALPNDGKVIADERPVEG
jgi:phenylacetate-CoA ligase